MNLKTAKIRILDLDLKGCVYLNHFSHSHTVANFFKRISRLGDGFNLVVARIGLQFTNRVFGSWFIVRDLNL